MKYNCTLISVKDIEKSKAFYKQTLGLRVVSDFGANVKLTGGLALQTDATYREFTGKNICYGGNDAEIYFEETDFDAFTDKLAACSVEYVHKVIEHTWGQRVVRFYDPDRHIIEVGENITSVCKRFLDDGMSPDEIAKRMDVPLKDVNIWLKLKK